MSGTGGADAPGTSSRRRSIYPEDLPVIDHSGALIAAYGSGVADAQRSKKLHIAQASVMLRAA
jgi:hypothetical protein